jgi:hypothetical protein
MSARSWCEARTQEAFVSVVDTNATEDDVLAPRDRAQPVFLCFQTSSEAGSVRIDRDTGTTEAGAARRRARPGGGVLHLKRALRAPAAVR